MQYNNVVKVLMPWVDPEDVQQITALTLDLRGLNYDRRKLYKCIARWYKLELGITIPRDLVKNPKFVQIFVLPNYDPKDLPDLTEEQERKLHNQLMEMHYEDERTTGV